MKPRFPQISATSRNFLNQSAPAVKTTVPTVKLPPGAQGLVKTRKPVEATEASLQEG
jgi:hypothetical protein